MKKLLTDALWLASVFLLVVVTLLKLGTEAGGFVAPGDQHAYEKRFLSELSRHTEVLAYKPVYYTQDKTIRGLQIKLRGCDAVMQIAIITQSNEALAMLKQRAHDARYETNYRFKGTFYRDFPDLGYWFSKTASTLAYKLQIKHDYIIDPVFVFMYPQTCRDTLTKLYGPF